MKKAIVAAPACLSRSGKHIIGTQELGVTDRLPKEETRMNWQKLYNPFVIALLRSPLHGLLDKHTMLITITGRKSGKRYTFPVSYMREGENLLVISQKDRAWWKNLRGGAQVLVFLQGHTLRARG